jgi:hypothetical protein
MSLKFYPFTDVISSFLTALSSKINEVEHVLARLLSSHRASGKGEGAVHSMRPAHQKTGFADDAVAFTLDSFCANFRPAR